jgi:transposase InsO family protein
MKVNMPRKIKKRVPKRERYSMIVVSYINAVWATDFMHDTLYCGRSIRTFNLLDESNREALGIDVAISIPSVRVTRFLDQLIEIYGVPDAWGAYVLAQGAGACATFEIEQVAQDKVTWLLAHTSLFPLKGTKQNL